MSFWDRLKPVARPPTPTAVDLAVDQLTLTLGWDDGRRTKVSARTLRQACPCAECVEEWTGRRTFDPESISAQMKVLEVGQVGNYALSFAFSDGHRLGIYNWAMLLQLSEQHPA